MSRSSVRRLLFALVLASITVAPAAAAEADAASLFVQAGGGDDAVRAVSLGVAWGLPWRARGGGLTTRLEVFASDWRTPETDGGRRSLLQVGVVPTVRLRPAAGRSPWFIDAGIGLSLLDGDLRTPHRTFSTRLNFSDNLAVGRSFGAQGEQELSLHLQHTSNAGIRKPNPGLDLVLLRYAHRF
jgi:lipid A 3-O-deacylase